MHTRKEDIARSRGSRAPVGDWHQCRRYWRRGLECAFHGREPDEEQDRDDNDPDDDVEQRVAPSPEVAPGFNDMVPVVAQRKTDQVLKEPARVGFGQKATAEADPVLDVVGVPVFPEELTPGKIDVPLYIPDENQFTYEGLGASTEVAAKGEEALVDVVAKSQSLAIHQEEALPDVGASTGQSAIGWEQLAYIFIGVFTANLLQHMRNVTVPPPPPPPKQPGPPQLFKPGQIKHPPIRMVPSNAPAGARGGGAGYQFISNPGSGNLPTPKGQDEWDVILDAAIPSPTVGGGQDID